MESWECADMTEENFAACPNLGPPPILETDSTQYQISAAKEQHKRKLELFKEQRFVERGIKNKLINAFDEIHLIDTKEEQIGYNNKSISNIFDYLWKSYEKVNDADLLSSKKPWANSGTPIHRYKQVEDEVKFAKLAGLTTQDKEKIAISHKLIHQTG